MQQAVIFVNEKCLAFKKKLINLNTFPLAALDQSLAKMQALYAKSLITVLRVEWISNGWKSTRYQSHSPGLVCDPSAY